MTYDQILLERSKLVERRFVHGHLTGAERRRKRRLERRLDGLESRRWHLATRGPRMLTSPSPELVEALSIIDSELKPIPIPGSKVTFEPFFRLELCNDDGTLFESVEAQTKEQAEEAFFAAAGMLLRYSKRK